MDIVDCEKAIVSVLNQSFFGQPANPAVLTNATVNGETIPLRVFRKYPSSVQLQSDMAASGVNITVNPMSGLTRFETGHQLDWQTRSETPITVYANTIGNTVTISGTGTSGLNVGIAYGGIGYQYRPADGDSPQVIANALASVIPNATVSNATITLNTVLLVQTGVVGDYTISREIDYQTQRFIIGIITYDPRICDIVGAQVRRTMAQVRALAGPDGDYTERPIYRSVFQPQKDEKVGFYIRNESYDITYGTYETITVAGILFVGLDSIISADSTAALINNSTKISAGIFSPDYPY